MNRNIFLKGTRSGETSSIIGLHLCFRRMIDWGKSTIIEVSIKHKQSFLVRSTNSRIWSYPPHFLFYVIPLSWLPYLSSYILWNMVTFVLYTLSIVWYRFQHIILIALVLAPASFVNILTGQNGFLSGALFMGGMLCLREFPILGGVLLGLSFL